MTTAMLPPLGLLTPPPVCTQQPLALSFAVVCDEPTARERLDLLRQLRRVSIGDAWVSGEYRVERGESDDGEYVRLVRGAHVRQRYDVDTAGRLRAALDSFADVLLGAGITDGWRIEGALYAALEQESDEAAEEMAYNCADCEAYAQEALVALPMRIDVYGFDDDEVTLGDGTINVIQEGSPFKVSASRSFVRDPRLSRLNPTQVSRAIQRAARIGLPLTSAPAHLKWCSEHPTPPRIDPRLLVTDPVAYWAQKGFVPRSQFSDAPMIGGKPKYSDGKIPVCKECRARHERMMYAALKAEQGAPIRPYNRRTTARPRATARSVA